MSNSTISGLDVSWTGEGKSGVGIDMRSCDSNTIEDVIATNRAIGIHVDWYGGDSSDNTFQHNNFSGAASWAMSAYDSRGVGNTYFHNNLSNSTNGVQFSRIDGLSLTADSFDFSAIPGTALYLVSVNNSTISGLDVSWTGEGKSGTGILISGSSGITLEALTVSGRATGVSIASASDVAVQCMSILDNTTGVYVTGSSSGIVLNYNHIAGNSNGVANSAAVVNAEYNYWGSPTGPSNLGGTGDSYSGLVDADPFLTRLPPCLNSAPVADAGPDQVLDQVGGEEAILVTLDGSGSYDPDGDPIVDYVWTGPFPEGGGTVHGVSPTVTLPVGTSTISLVVNDGYAVSAADTVDIAVNRTTWYVDDDGPGDPGPNDNTESDPAEDGSPAHPFDRIQEGIDASADAHTVQVAAGTYPENLTWDTKAIDLIGAGAADTIVDAGGVGGCLTITDVPDTASVEGFTFTGGSGSFGGGLYVSHSFLVISNNTITENTAVNYGGGIYLGSSSAVVVNNTIWRNAANHGGGIWSGGSSSMIANNVIAENRARSQGGGVYIGPSSPKMVNNTITGNTAQAGGGIYIYHYNSLPLIANNILAFNSSGIENGGRPTLSHNCVYGNGLYDYLGVSPGVTDISEDPKLVAVSYGRLHIQPDSPCRNAGDDSVVVSGWRDMDDEPRIQETHVDMGADESDGTGWVFSPRVVRVTLDGNDSNDGSNWNLAKGTIQAAVDEVAHLGGEVWVAAGAYDERIAIPSYVYVYGGFSGTEAERSERDWQTNTTMVDGQQGGSVVSVEKTGYLLNTIDGFTIRNGAAPSLGGGIYAYDSSPSIRNNTITGNTAVNYGGGIHLGYSSAVVMNNTIRGNTASRGGGIYSGGSSPMIANNVVAENRATHGGGFYISTCSPRIVNNTITANTAQAGGGIYIYHYYSCPLIANNILAFNSSGISNGGRLTLSHNNVFGNGQHDYLGVSPGGTDISEDPKFVAASYGRLHIQPDSSCVDAGDNSVVGAAWVDMDGEPRVHGMGVDIGADESNGTTWLFSPQIVRVKPDGDDANDGSTWDLAKRTVQAGIDEAAISGGEVWVAAGNYVERIAISSYVYLYGGFEGNEAVRTERDWQTNTVVLDGQQGGSVVSVEEAGYLLNTIDGFTIRNGAAPPFGGGIYAYGSSPIIRNNTITENTAVHYGGGIYLAYSSAVVIDNTIHGNSANYGAGIWSGSYPSTIANNVIAENRARTQGGGVYVSTSSPRIVNNTITGNTARTGGGIYVYHGTSYPLIANNIMAFNSSGIANGGHPTLSHNCVYGNEEYQYLGVSPGEGDISTDPLFVDYGSGDFHLTRESPCVDAGDDSAVMPDWVDMDGEPRIQGDGVDIGADERVPNEPPIADAGGPYEVIVGGTVRLDASGTTDLDQPDETLTYEWDLDGDGLFGLEDPDPARGDEVGITPTFSAVGLAGLSSVTVTLRVTDEGDLWSEDTAEIDIIYVSDLSVSSSEIAFSPLNPAAGQQVTISATVANQGLEDAAGIDVSFFDFDTLIGQATIGSLAAGATADVSIPALFPEASFRLITVKVDPADTIVELNENNNEASSVLQVGQPTTGAAAIVVSASPATAERGRPAGIYGTAYYDFETVDGEQDYPVQGAQVTVTVIDPGTSDVLGVFTGAHTSTSGAFGQGILAPAEIGEYQILVEITDQSATGETQTTLVVEESDAEPIVPPPSVPGGEVRDVFIVSENLHFSDDNPDLGEPITVFAFVQYVGAEPAEDVPVTVSDIFPVAGELQEFQIGRVTVDFPASPDTSSYVTVSVPWANTAEGAHVIQVAVEPDFAQRGGNDRATRLIYVGDPPLLVTLDKSVSLLADSDGNSIPSPGDTLAYTISYANLADIPVNTGVILDDFDEALLQMPFNISDNGTLADGTITWDLGTIAAGATGSVTYEVVINPPAEFPGGMTTVVNTAIFDTDQTAPVAVTAQIVVVGDSIAPTTGARLTPEPNSYGWNNTDVTLILTATDNPGGSGAGEIVYSIDGGPATTVPGDLVTLEFADEGIFSVAYHAVDVALNVEATQTIVISIDKTAPVPVHGGPFSVDEGDSIQLNGAGSTDGLSGVDSTEWSIDGDRLFDDGDPAPFAALDGPSTYNVSLQVADRAGNVAIADTQVHVRNVDPTPSITDVIQPRLEGTEIVVTGSATDPAGPYDTLTYSWTVEKDGVAFADGSGVDLTEFRFTPDDNADYRIVLTVADEDGGSSTVEQTISVANVAPELVLNPVMAIDENGVATLTGTISDSGVLDTFTLDIDWDGDGIWDETHEDLPAGEFSYTHQFLDDSPSGTPVDDMPINVRVTDDDTGEGTAGTTVEVTNVAPVIVSFSSDATFDDKAAEEEPVEFTASFTDVGTLDTHTAEIDWGDGQTSAVTVDRVNRTLTATHAYAPGGVFTATLTVTDDDTGSAVEIATAVVTGARINGDVLQIVGSDDDDHVAVNQQGNGLLKVHTDFFPEGNFRTFNASEVTLIRMWLCSGDDLATVAGNIDLPAIIEGRWGNDHLNAGGGPTVLLGGPGNDTLISGSGRDVLIGGLGADRLVGGPDEDILIGGTTAHDANDAALLDILEAWNSGDAFAERQLTLAKWLNDATVPDDEDEDVFTGTSGEDWFFEFAGDVVTDGNSNGNGNGKGGK